MNGEGEAEPSPRRDPRRGGGEGGGGRAPNLPAAMLVVHPLLLPDRLQGDVIGHDRGSRAEERRRGRSAKQVRLVASFRLARPTPSLSALGGTRAAACRTRAGWGMGGVAQVTWILTPARAVPFLPPPEPTEPGVGSGRRPFAGRLRRWCLSSFLAEGDTSPAAFLAGFIPSLVAVSSRHSAIKAWGGSGAGI